MFNQGNDKLSVLHCTDVWLPQTHTWLFNQVRCLPAKVESHIVCEAEDNGEQFGLPNIHNMGRVKKAASIYRRFLRKCGLWRSLNEDWRKMVGKKVKAGILHSNFGPCGWENVPVARKLGAKHVVSFYGADASKSPYNNDRWQARYRELFENVHCVLAEGPHLRSRLEQLGCPRDKVHLHHLGVCVSEIPFLARRWEKKSPLKILIAASFREKKGIPYALQALGIVANETDLEITIIGDAAKGEAASVGEKKLIFDTIASEGLTNKVRLLGFQPHRALLAEAQQNHIFISPSVTAGDGDTEGGLPVALIEMAATGIPVVSTRHCDIPEAFPDQSIGFLAEERNVAELVAHLRFLMAHEDSWPMIGTNARRHVSEHFDADKQGGKLFQIYQELCTRKSAPRG